MVSQNGIKLAVDLVTHYFGDIVAKVCECLLRRGTVELGYIIKNTELRRQSVVNSLLVLIQHNCVQAFAIQQQGAFGEPPRMITRYMVLFDNIIHHMRFPKFLALVSREFKIDGVENKDCEGIFKGLLEHGRLSLDQIIDRHQDKGTSGENTTSRSHILQNFKKLAESYFIEHCPAHEPFLEPPADEENNAKKRGAKSNVAGLPETLEARALAAATPMQSLRFSVEADALIDDIPGQASQENPTNLTVGGKRKQDSLDSGTKTWDTNKKEVLWRVNFEECVRRLRNEYCIAEVKRRFDDEARIVVAATLELSRTTDTTAKTEKSAHPTLQRIFDEVIKSEDGRLINKERVRDILDQLGCESEGKWSIDLKNIIDFARTQEVETIVLEKYGREAYRIFRLLAARGDLLDTDKISDTTFVEKKDATKHLFALWKDEFVHLEKMQTDRADMLLWKVENDLLSEHVLDDLYHAALNLRLRLADEYEKENEIVQVARTHKVLDDAVRSRLKRLAKIKNVLFSSLMKIDDAVMLFYDFKP